jgi:FAD/FMN-containing dehydrogenase
MLLERTPDRADPGIDALRAHLLGPVLTPGDAQYDTARRVWNRRYVRQPAAVIRARDAVDVLRVVAYAREQKLPLAIRSGGHGLAGFGTTDGGVVLDLSLLKRISIDADCGIATVQPGVTSDELARKAADYGLGLSTGAAAAVGMGGLALGGGIGFMVRKYGLTIDSLLSADVVTADGHFITASTTEHAELFWALRGGGGNFGVITNFQFQLRPVETILGGAILCPASVAALRTYLDYAIAAQDELTTIAYVMKAPPSTLVMLIVVAFVGDLEAGQRALAPLRNLSPDMRDLTGPMPYPAMFDLTRETTVSTHHYGRSAFLQELPDVLLESLLHEVERGTGPLSLVQIRPLGGAMARVPADATGFAHRDRRYALLIDNSWDAATPEEESIHTAWGDRLWHLVRPLASGAYVNFLEDGEEDRIRQAYPGETFDRLAAVKRRYDPDNFFRINHNIHPA